MASSSSSSGGQMHTDPRPAIPGATLGGTRASSDSSGSAQGSLLPFDIFEWFPRYQSCQKYFLDRSQHTVPVRALAAFMNILLPCQRHPHPVMSAADVGSPAQPGTAKSFPFPPHSPNGSQTVFVSLIPYIRRLVATGMDQPGVLHGFFGDDWATGVGSLHEQERRNFLFAAKSGGWESVKRDYDILPYETVPFLRPIQSTSEPELEAAEKCWSEWMFVQEWRVGPRAPRPASHDSDPARQRRTGRP